MDNEWLAGKLGSRLPSACRGVRTLRHTFADGARQELDFISVSSDLRVGLSRIKGGVDDFPDVWDMSDHAPVAVSLSF